MRLLDSCWDHSRKPQRTTIRRDIRMAKISAAIAASALVLALSASAFADDAGSSATGLSGSPRPSSSDLNSNNSSSFQGSVPTNGQTGSSLGTQSEQSAQMPSAPNTDKGRSSIESQSDRSIGKRNNDAGNNQPASNSSSMH